MYKEKITINRNMSCITNYYVLKCSLMRDSGIAKWSVPDETAPLRADFSGATLFAIVQSIIYEVWVFSTD